MNIVTGAFSYTGQYIARRLLALGEPVKTLTGHPDRAHPFSKQISVAPLDFENPGGLAENLRGATTLYNTYWVRFDRGAVSYAQAVENSRTLVRAAEDAGVRRIVHISVTNASRDSCFPYFRGKGLVEEAIIASRLSYAILRPTVVFGRGDILINNIAWLLRQLPVFTVPGPGDYRVQPVFVDDLAELAVRLGHERENQIVDAVGPEVFGFEELVGQMAQALGSRVCIVHANPPLTLGLVSLLGMFVRDVVLTREEIGGLMANLLVSSEPPTCSKRFSAWLKENAECLGRRYASELARHFR